MSHTHSSTHLSFGTRGRLFACSARRLLLADVLRNVRADAMMKMVARARGPSVGRLCVEFQQLVAPLLRTAERTMGPYFHFRPASIRSRADPAGPPCRPCVSRPTRRRMPL